MFDNDDLTTESLYQKYMAFNRIMLEEYSPMELASILVVQGLTMFKTVMSDDDYQTLMKMIYDKRDAVKTLE